MVKILIAYNPLVDGNDFDDKPSLSNVEYVSLFDGDEVVSAIKKYSDFGMLVMTSSVHTSNLFDMIVSIRKARPDLPVVLLVNCISVGTLKIAISAGCNEVIKYPLRAKEMAALVTRYCPMRVANG